MFFGHIVIGNWQFVIGNWKFVISNWKFVIGNWKFVIGNWKFVIGNLLVSVQSVQSLVWFGLLWYNGMVWYGLVWFGLVVRFGLVWYGLVWWWGGGMFWNVLEYSRKFQESPKSFMVGGGGGGTKQLQCLLRSRLPDSEIEIELEMTWDAFRVDLEMVWTRV